MARFAYFADMQDGTTHEWRDTVVKGRVIAARGVDYISRGNIRGYVEGLGWVKITRSIEMKSNPSRHVCDTRCINATGKIMRCECSCGGKNHGRGSFVCDEAA